MINKIILTYKEESESDRNIEVDHCNGRRRVVIQLGKNNSVIDTDTNPDDGADHGNHDKH
jgi:hypothetical protein